MPTNTPIIEVKNISKRYTITHERGGYVALRDVIATTLRKPFAFAKTKARRMVGLEKKEEFWALKNVSFEINKGEIVGVIGANGAGKSTLLKILSQITPPTEGEIILRGKVGSLLEVGTGFHPELTGRENIFLNGAIMGMTGKEIARKFDQIVEFAGIGKFIDTPVKRYSSGMYVRLAFSVAAHMEPEILLVDEVLAVGDAEFQKKCLGKMEEVTRDQKRTIMFISHNLDAIKRLCPRTILFSKGKIDKIGPTDEIINHYLHTADTPSVVVPRATSKDFHITRLQSVHGNNRPWTFPYGEPIEVEVELEVLVDQPSFQIGFFIDSINSERVGSVHDDVRQLEKGTHIIKVQIQNILLPNSYELGVSVQQQYYMPGCAVFHVVDPHNQHNPVGTGLVEIASRFSHERVS